MVYKIAKNENRELDRVYERAMKDLGEFFEIDWTTNQPKLWIVEDGETAVELRGGQGPRWVKGWGGLNAGGVYILKNEIIKQETGDEYNDEKYEALIKHELAHCYADILTGGKRKPKWLTEGLSLFLADQLQWRKEPKELSNFLSFYEEDERVYEESGFAVRNLIKKYGKDKLFELLKGLKEKESTEVEFKKLFKEVYEVDLSYAVFD